MKIIFNDFLAHPYPPRPPWHRDKWNPQVHRSHPQLCYLLAHEPGGAWVSSGSSASLRPLRPILSSGTRDSNLALMEKVEGGEKGAE